MIAQATREPLTRAFLCITAATGIVLAFISKMPVPQVVVQISMLLVPVYFVVAHAGSIIEKTDRWYVELLLAKPFSRTTIIVADYLGASAVVCGLVAIFGSMIALLYAVRVGSVDPRLFSFPVAIMLSFLTVYPFVIVTGILTRSIQASVAIWSVYLLLGALFLEVRATVIFPHIEFAIMRDLLDTVYYLLPQTVAMEKSLHILFAHGELHSLPIVISLCVGGLALGTGVVIFRRRDIE
jgi:ABC-type transport system involved in multi-copper enzyme maturation permease subunit